MFINTNLIQIVSAMSSAPTGDVRTNELAMHNLKALKGYFIKYTPECNSFGCGEMLFGKIQSTIAEINANTSEMTIPTNMFVSWGFRICVLDKDVFEKREKLTNALYFYFDQMRSLVPAVVYEKYETEFRKNNLSKCYSIINSVYGDASIAECGFIKAHEQKKVLEASKQSGLLFVDLKTAQTYFLKVKLGNKSKVLIVPNGFLNIYTFYTYSLHLIDIMINDSAYAMQINKVKAKLFGGEITTTNNATVYSTVCEYPITKILAFKHYVYCMFSLEILGVDSKTSKAIGEELESKLFANQSKAYIIRNELNVQDYMESIVLTRK